MNRLLAPRSVAVVGATERADAYGSEAILNLRRIGFTGTVRAVNPGRSAVHGVPAVPSLSDLDAPPDAVVVAVPAARVAEVVDEAAAVGAGGAVVFAAGFEEAGRGPLRADLPICGPNGNGIVAFHEPVAMWGDVIAPKPPGDVALIAQSGNVAVNALASRHRWHTVVSCGNADPAPFAAAVEGARAVALYLEADGDGAAWRDVLAGCDVPVVVLKAGRSPQGAAAAQAHTGAVAGDHRAVRAFFEACGAHWAEDPHDLLELSQALARHRPGAGRIGIMTCSGGDSAVAADLAAELELELPPPTDPGALRALLPEEATVANPLDYTSLLWDDRERLDALTAAFAAQYDRVITFFDAANPAWPRPSGIVASTLPELASEDGIAGLRTAMRVAKALTRRKRAVPLFRPRAPDGPQRWLSEPEAKALLAPDVPEGEVVTAPGQVTLTGRVAVKAVGAHLHHKAAAGAIVLDPGDVPAAVGALLPLTGAVLVERLVAPGPEWFVAVRRDTIVPVLAVGPGGAHAERLDAATVLPLPAAEADVAALTDAATARLALRAAAVAEEHDLVLLELNPVIAGIAVDAIATQGGVP